MVILNSTLSGRHALTSTQIDGIITFPVAVYGYYFFPDTPTTTTARYLSQEEKELAIARVPITEEKTVMNAAFVRNVMTSWYVYGFGILWVLANCSEAFSSQSLLNLYMQAHPTITYTVSQLNNYPTGVPAVGIVSTLLWATYTDIYGRRYITGFHNAVVGICTAAIILAPSTSTAGIFGAYYWAGTIYCCQATFFAWANDTMRGHPPALRAFVIGFMNFGGNSFQVWWPLIFYRADAAPMFKVRFTFLFLFLLSPFPPFFSFWYFCFELLYLALSLTAAARSNLHDRRRCTTRRLDASRYLIGKAVQAEAGSFGRNRGGRLDVIPGGGRGLEVFRGFPEIVDVAFILRFRAAFVFIFRSNYGASLAGLIFYTTAQHVCWPLR